MFYRQSCCVPPARADASGNYEGDDDGEEFGSTLGVSGDGASESKEEEVCFSAFACVPSLCVTAGALFQPGANETTISEEPAPAPPAPAPPIELSAFGLALLKAFREEELPAELKSCTLPLTDDFDDRFPCAGELTLCCPAPPL